MKLKDLANRVQATVKRDAELTRTVGGTVEKQPRGAALEAGAKKLNALAGPAQATGKRDLELARAVGGTIEKQPGGPVLANELESARRALPVLKDGFDATRPVRDYAYNLITSDGAWGQSVPVDTGTERPFRVGYGEKLRTLAEVQTPRPKNLPKGVELAGARARVYGDASAKTLSAAIGVEAEAGLKAGGQGTGASDDGATSEWLGEAFVGARTRHTAEVGVLGSSLGSETFIGAEGYASEKVRPEGTDDNTLTMRAQIQAGFRAGAHVSADVMGIAAEERMEFGVRVRGDAERDLAFGGPLPVGERLAGHADAFAGMTEGIHGKMGTTGLGAGGEWFAGARAGIEGRLALTFAHHELAGVGARAEGWAGLGAKAEAGIEVDKKHKALKMGLDAGLAIGVGGGVAGEVTLGGDGVGNFAGADSDGQTSASNKPK